MTNEQKAQQIIGCNRANCLECGGSLSVVNGCTEFERIMAMAEWKEKQMIEKACEKLVEIELEDKDTEDVANEEQDNIYVLNNHFLKKFKQEMEE